MSTLGRLLTPGRILPFDIAGLSASPRAGTRAAVCALVRRIWTTLLILTLSISGVAVAADVLVVTEREQLDSFVDTVTRNRVEERLDGALSYLDPSAVPCRLQHGAEAQEFGAGESNELADALRSALGVFDSTEQHLLQHAVKVEDDRATVTTRMGDPGYEQTVIYDLVRTGERWLVKRVRTL
ncbi:MAG: hypothetical protein JWN48_153 [Myxococcaceae bacterium]|nr:hypothetical protein [Myxococcaceae bacterium]